MLFKKKDNNKVTLFLLIAAILGVTAVIAYQTYIIHSLKGVIQESQGQKIHVNLGPLEEKLNSGEGTLAVVKKSETEIKLELEELKVKLNQTEAMLSDANEQKKLLEQKNAEMVKQLTSLKEELRLWSGQISNLEEKGMVLDRRAKGLKELKQRIRDFKVKAQKEMDRIKMELGNHGYLTKQGKTTFSRQNIVELERIIITHSPAK